MNYIEGQKVRITGNTSEHLFYIGEVVCIKALRPCGGWGILEDGEIDCYFAQSTTRSDHSWYIVDSECELVSE